MSAEHSSTILSESTRTAMSHLDLHGARPKPSMIVATQGVIAYELARAFSVWRVLLWVGLAMFPAVLMTSTLFLIRMLPTKENAEQFTLLIGVMLFVLLPQVLTVLCMLLWVVPIVNSELEGQTWVYSVVRPNARRSIMLGKYIVAVLWIGSCTTTSTILCTVLAWLLGISDMWTLCRVLICVNWIAAITYGALMMLIGSVFQRRPMVVAFAYSIAIEAIMGWVPAVINRFTISYRLRSLMLDWMNLDYSKMPEEFGFFWEAATWRHLSILAAATLLMIGVTLWRVERGQFRFQSEY